MDETWDPGDQEQASDRIILANKSKQVAVYTIRSNKTIEEYIERVLLGKENVNKVILDLRRQGLRAVQKEA
jgi:SNF2 family DNA or RNA helicase